MSSPIMPRFLVLFILACAALVLQCALLPAFAPRVLQPDLFVLCGIAALAFGSLDFGLTALFVLGLVSDLAGSGRVGLTPLCYLVAAALILKLSQRELTRGHLATAYAAGFAATLLAQVLYAPLSALCGQRPELGAAAAHIASTAIASLVWGLPAAYLSGALMYKLQVMSPQVRARWSNHERTSDAQRRQGA